MSKHRNQFCLTRVVSVPGRAAKMHFPISLIQLTIAVIILSIAQCSSACDLQIISAGPCLANAAAGTPNVGDSYALKVTFRVVGTPTNHFRVKFELANTTWYTSYINGQSGGNYWYWYWNTLALDDAMPWRITLDPDGLSGDTQLANNTTNGMFTPTPPTNAVDIYAPRTMHGFQSSVFTFQPGSGTIGYIHVLFGVPTSHGAQSIIATAGSTNGSSVVTAPYGVPVFQITRTNVPAATFQDTNTFVAQLNKIRVNPGILRTNTWANMSTLTTNWTQWLTSDSMCESTNSQIVSFVQQALPSNYQTTMTPYDTARTLHRAVMKALKYQYPPLHGDAVRVMQDGIADCGGFSALLTACLRNVGIPARRISGFFQGASMHVRVEFHLPGTEWLVADPTYGNGADSTGTYAYYFGYVPNANSFLAVDVGDIHVLSYHTFAFIQVPNWWWSGGATLNSNGSTSYFQPDGILRMTNSPKGYISFYLTDVPSQGAVVVQTSTNMMDWSAVVTNSASGTNINYSFPATNAVRGFYRANVIP
jgi:hypothetical protein